MIMWLFIFAGMFLASVAGILYLISRFYKTECIKKITKERKVPGIAAGTCIVLALIILCWLWVGSINTAVVIVHVLCIWILLDLIVWVFTRKTGKKVRYDLVVLCGIVINAAYMGWGWYEGHHVVATSYTVSTTRTAEQLRIVQISDSHLGTTFDGDGFAKEVEKIRKENPDVVVVTGDFVDDDTTREDMIKSCEALGRLETKYGIYYVFGNHDKGYNSEARGFSAEDMVRELEANGVRVLQDETVEIAGSYYLIGRQDRSEESFGRSRASMEELIRGLDPEKYMIVLDHQPNDFDAQEKSGVDLVLSGHTHGGQFIPINYLGEWTGQNDMTYGIRKRGNTTFEVSSGISDWAIKFKTGCKSEYVVLDIVPEQNAEGEE